MGDLLEALEAGVKFGLVYFVCFTGMFLLLHVARKTLGETFVSRAIQGAVVAGLVIGVITFVR
ncbi:hypothetical protein [Nesterenkonia rhizosphaerae]|uniref:Uncharacterized protein n=1 Tax=Nesterenkonia rhizosphaerae TaxID=1348272 RepID=A0ABP9FTC8_9MICC